MKKANERLKNLPKEKYKNIINMRLPKRNKIDKDKL